MVNRPRNLEVQPENGSNTFDLTILDKPGGTPVQPTRNANVLDVFNPSLPSQDDPADFIVPQAMIWNEDTETLAAPPLSYNAPTVTGILYGGTTGRFLTTLLGAATVPSSALALNERWAIVYDTEVNGFAYRTYEFFTVTDTPGSSFGAGAGYGDPETILRRTGVTYSDLGFASQAQYDAFIEDLNLRASDLIDSETNRDFRRHDDVVRLDGTDLPEIALPGYPVIELESVLEDDSVLEVAEYRVKRTGAAAPNSGVIERKPPGIWFDGWENYEFTYSWGYDAPPFVISSIAENLVVRTLQAAAAADSAPGATSYSMDGFAVAYDKDMLRTLLSEDDRLALGRFRRILTV